MKEFFKAKWKIIVASVCAAILLAGTVCTIVIFTGDKPKDPPVVPPQTSEGEPNTDGETPPVVAPVNTFSITLMSDGSEVGKINDIVEGTTVADVAIPVKDGINNTFLGYFTAENGEGTEVFYADGVYTNANITEDVTVYAYFRPTTEIYTLSETTITGMTGTGKTYARLSIPSGATSIGSYSFYGCAGLISIAIPSSVTGIEVGAFYGCTSLKSIMIPEGLTTIKGYAFNNCTSLESITIPEGVTTLGDTAFGNCTSLKSITIPSSVTSMDMYVFCGCTSLESVTISEEVTRIGGSMFEGCTGITSISIPSSVTSIGENAFKGCTGLTSITISEGVTSIGENAFEGCTELTSITIPSSVTSIDTYVFKGCTNLDSVTFESHSDWIVIDDIWEPSEEINVVLTDSSTNAIYLTNTYSNYYWKKNVE